MNATHHISGDPTDNRPENLEVVDLDNAVIRHLRSKSRLHRRLTDNFGPANRYWFTPSQPPPTPRLRYCRLVEVSTRGVADRFRAQFRKADGRWEPGMEDLWARLVAMGDRPPLHLVVELLGSREWTHPRCAVTGERVEAAVEFGEAVGDTFLVGVETLREAMTLVEG